MTMEDHVRDIEETEADSLIEDEVQIDDDVKPAPMDEEFDKTGDVTILTAELKRFRVSSNILVSNIICMSLADRHTNIFQVLMSEPFKAMLTAPMREGLYPRSKEQPLLLRLFDDDGESLKLLMHLCHFSTWITTFSPSCEQLENLVRLADKYLYRHVVAPQCGIWLGQYPLASLDASDLNTLARVAQKLDNDVQFLRITKALIQGFTDGALKVCLRPGGLLPSTVRKERMDLLVRMQEAIESTVSELRQHDGRNTVYGTYIWCPDCGEDFHQQNIEDTGRGACCRFCGNDNAEELVCNAANCFRDMTTFLADRLSFWPVSGIMTSRPVDIVEAADDLGSTFHQWGMHRCGAEKSCPMYGLLYKLEGELKDVYQKVGGIDLETFKSEVLYTSW